MATSTYKKTVEKLISVLTGVSAINTPVGGRVYGSHPSTIQDVIYPCISIHLIDGSKFVDTAGIENFMIQIDLWFRPDGQNNSTWDDVMDVWAEILSALHENSFSASGIKIFKVNNIAQGPQMYEDDPATLHFPSRFAVRALAS